MLLVLGVLAGSVAFPGSVAAATDSQVNGEATTAAYQQTASEYDGGAVHYDDTATATATIEVPFDGNVSAASITAENFTLLDDNEDVSEVVDYTASRSQHDGGGQVELVTTEVVVSNDLEVELSGTIASNPGEKSVAFAGAAIDYGDLNGNSEYTEFRGTTIAFYNASGVTEFEIEDDESGFEYSRLFAAGMNSEVFYFETDDRNLGDYTLNDPNQKLTLTDLGLSVSVEDTSVTPDENIEGTVDANAGERPIEIELVDDGGDGDVVDSIETTTSGQGDADFSFSADRDGGEYAVQVTDTRTGLEAESSAITIPQGEATTTFARSTITEHRGDIAEITVEIDASRTATITLGDTAGDQGVVANVTVEDGNDDGRVTVYLNTYELQTAPSAAAPFAVDSESDDSIASQDVSRNVTDLIDAGDYDLEVVAGEDPVAATGGNADAVATLVLQERGTERLRMWTGSKGALGSGVNGLEGVSRAIEDGETAQSSDVAVGDYAVHQLEASGLEGALDARENDEVTDEFLALTRSGPIDLTIETVGSEPNRAADTLALGSDNVTVIADGPNDTYFVIVDTATVDLVDTETGATSDLPADEDTELETNFTVRSDDAGFDFTDDEAFDDDENEETFVEFTAAEPEVTIDEPYAVSAAAGRTMSGTTNIAPGTELTVRVRSRSGTSPSFLKTANPVVQPDGTWSATFDFSEQNVGDEYDIVVNANLLDSAEEENGEVVAAVGSDTTPPAADTDTVTPSTDTSAPDTDTPTPDEQDTQTSMPTTDADTATPTSTPGFGVAAALAALLAAALLAVRRE